MADTFVEQTLKMLKVLENSWQSAPGSAALPNMPARESVPRPFTLLQRTDTVMERYGLFY
jgi:hypothetical protein